MLDGSKSTHKYQIKFEIKAVVTINIMATTFANALTSAKQLKPINFLNREIVNQIHKGTVTIIQNGKNE